jgi:hypothetical protein
LACYVTNEKAPCAGRVVVAEAAFGAAKGALAAHAQHDTFIKATGRGALYIDPQAFGANAHVHLWQASAVAGSAQGKRAVSALLEVILKPSSGLECGRKRMTPQIGFRGLKISSFDVETREARNLETRNIKPTAHRYLWESWHLPGKEFAGKIYKIHSPES